MWVECMAIREGKTIVDFKDFRYTFIPPLDALKGEWTTSIADIDDEAALKYFLGEPEKGIKGKNFRHYDRDRTYAEMVQRRREQADKDKRFKGYSLEKIELMGQDRGYMIVDYRGDTPKFMGAEGKFTGAVNEISPFGNLRKAEEYLTMFTRGEKLPEFVPKKEYPCKQCEESFDDPIQLAEHWRAAHQQPQAAEATEDKIDKRRKEYRTPSGSAEAV